MRIAIRADASTVMGTGHLHRTVALAHALRTLGADVSFVTRPLGIKTEAILADYPVIALTEPCKDFPSRADVPHAVWAGVDEMDDARETAERLADRAAPDWVIVDSYAFGAAWHDAVRAATDARIAAIDDLADRMLAADLVIDHNQGAEQPSKYVSVAHGAPILGGPRFALLGPAYAAADRYVPHDAVRSIGIFMGGVDSIGATATVLDALAGLDLPMEVATTSANPHLPALRKRTDISLVVDQPDLAAFFARHDLQVGAGGGASWERCCIGAPTLLLAVAENQRASVPGLVAIEAAATADFNRPAIRNEVNALIADPTRRRNLAERARSLVDGRGAMRVALRLMRDALTVRPASSADAALIFEWRNDPATRRASRGSAPIAWDMHRAWLDTALADPTRILLIAEIGPIPVGVIRFDRIGSAAVEVSLYLDPAMHGLGLGRHMLRAGEAALPPIDIHAEVMEGNSGSASMFARAGYTPNGNGNWFKPARDGDEGER